MAWTSSHEDVITLGTSHCGSAVTTQLVSLRTQVWSLASFSGLRIQRCRAVCVGHRRGSDPSLLWLWLAATAPIPPLAWELPYATSVALKRPKEIKNKKRKCCILFLRTLVRVFAFKIIHKIGLLLLFCAIFIMIMLSLLSRLWKSFCIYFILCTVSIV